MEKYIGFDVDDKKTVACLVQMGKKDVYATIPTEVAALKRWLQKQRKCGGRLNLTFEVSVMSGRLYDGLVEVVDSLEEKKVSDPL